ncbi:hypothetical protein [Moraxella lacunata]|nr:hypothetical protein [Moraxella lacunata]
MTTRRLPPQTTPRLPRASDKTLTVVTPWEITNADPIISSFFHHWSLS